MSILDKHPAPWTIGDPPDEGAKAGDMADANERQVVFGIEAFADAETKRLILAAPELLAALKTCPWLPRNETTLPNGMVVPGDYKKTSAWLDAAEALIARIEGGNA